VSLSRWLLVIKQIATENRAVIWIGSANHSTATHRIFTEFLATSASPYFLERCINPLASAVLPLEAASAASLLSFGDASQEIGTASCTVSIQPSLVTSFSASHHCQVLQFIVFSYTMCAIVFCRILRMVYSWSLRTLYQRESGLKIKTFQPKWDWIFHTSVKQSVGLGVFENGVRRV
jgi:hypothetical protein